MEIKLTETQQVIITRAIARNNIVAAYDHTTTTCSARAYKIAITMLIKSGMIEARAGLKGLAQDGDHSVEDNRRLYVSPALLKAMYGDEPEASKATKIKKAAKVAATTPAVVETPSDELDDADDLDMEIDSPKSVVAESYKKQYSELKAMGGSGQGCNDPIDRFFRAHFMGKVNGKGRARLDVVALVQFAIDNSLWSDKWDLVNNGQKRMNTANALRRAIAKGQQIRFNKRTINFDA